MDNDRLYTFVELASDYSKNANIIWNKMYISVKFNGMRCVWDGGISLGCKMQTIPYCNYEPYMEDKISSGLWTRNGKPIYAPDSFIKHLPTGYILDGELIGVGGYMKFEDIISICRNEDRNSDSWGKIEYNVFDVIPRNMFLRPRVIMDREKHWSIRDHKYVGLSDKGPLGCTLYQHRYELLTSLEIGQNYWKVIHQNIIHYSKYTTILEFLERAICNGYEGIMLRNPNSLWLDIRSNNLCKLKPSYDDEGVVVKTQPGTNRLKGKIGALILQTKYGLVKIGTGLTDVQRSISPSEWKGKTVKYYYKELTKKGVPRHPSFGSIIS